MGCGLPSGPPSVRRQGVPRAGRPPPAHFLQPHPGGGCSRAGSGVHPQQPPQEAEHGQGEGLRGSMQGGWGTQLKWTEGAQVVDGLGKIAVLEDRML